MNILYCIPHLYNAGGMERVLTQKVNWLAAHTDHQFTILTTERTPAGQADTYFDLDARVQVVPLNIDFDADYNKPLLFKWYAHMRRMRAYKRALTEYIRAQQIDLCISLCGKEIAFLRHLPCRTIAELHFAKNQRQQLLEANHAGVFWSILGRIRNRQLVRAVKPLERLVVLTEADKNDWIQAGCTNVTVIPNICSMYGRQLKVKVREKIVLAVGRLHEQKGFDMLLEAWKPIEKRYPEWTLRIVGEGPKRTELEAQIAHLQLRHVVLAGRGEDMYAEYAAASLFVLSSRYEGQPLALIEAMWNNLPCIAFDCPHGPAELLAEGRGWCVENGNIQALTQQIEYALSHQEDAQRCAFMGQLYVINTYSELEIMPKWIEVIERKKLKVERGRYD